MVSGVNTTDAGLLSEPPLSVVVTNPRHQVSKE
jgi:hypothetical protein